MSQPDRPPAGPENVSRTTLRLTFKVSDDGIELMSSERLDMITPPQPGERPEAGVNDGHWFELRDADGSVLAHRLIDTDLLNSVEIHTPEGITREFGAVVPGVFEVLLPDIAQAREAVLVGNPLRPPRARENHPSASADIARFELR